MNNPRPGVASIKTSFKGVSGASFQAPSLPSFPFQVPVPAGRDHVHRRHVYEQLVLRAPRHGHRRHHLQVHRVPGVRRERRRGINGPVIECFFHGDLNSTYAKRQYGIASCNKLTFKSDLSIHGRPFESPGRGSLLPICASVATEVSGY